MNTNQQNLPSQLAAAREDYRSAKYRGPAPDFGPDRSNWQRIWPLAAGITAIALIGVLVNDPAVEWDPDPSIARQVGQMPPIARPHLPQRPAMPARPSRPSAFGTTAPDDLG